MITSPSALGSIDEWPVPNAAAGCIGPDGGTHTHGDSGRPFALASITKPLFAYAVLVAVEEGSLDLDGGTGWQGVTVRHLLAHAGGFDPDRREQVAAPGARRIYSNAGFEILGDVLHAATGFSPAEYLHAAVAEPLGMTSTRLSGSPAHAAESSVDDLLRFCHELRSPSLLAPSTVADACTPQFPELDGVLPGYGRQRPNPWGLGFEIRGAKAPHWTAPTNSPSTFGHFGRAGTMLWVDPVHTVAAVALTDRTFGAWAIDVWPPFSGDLLVDLKEI